MDNTEFIRLLYIYTGNFAVVCLGITIFIGLFNYKALKTPFRRLLLFLIWNFGIEILARVFTYSGISNLILLHVYTLGEFLLFSWFYESLISQPKFFRKRFNLFVTAGCALIILYFLVFYNLGDYNPLTKTLVQIIIITYAILYFYNLTDNQSHSSRLEKSLRLINSAVLIYYSGSLFIFMTSQALSIYPEWIRKTFWGFNASLNLIFQLLILWSIWKVVYKKTPSSS